MRVFWCPKHQRVTEDEFLDELDYLGKHKSALYACEHCRQWYLRLPRFKAKRNGES